MDCVKAWLTVPTCCQESAKHNWQHILKPYFIFLDCASYNAVRHMGLYHSRILPASAGRSPGTGKSSHWKGACSDTGYLQAMLFQRAWKQLGRFKKHSDKAGESGRNTTLWLSHGFLVFAQ